MPAPQSALTTRQRILAHLAEHHVASARSLSREWGMTREDIRYQFNSLLADGLVEPAPRAPGGAHPGRPEKFYRLAARAAPNNLPALCCALIETLSDLTPAEEEAALREAASRLPAPAAAKPSPVQRMNEAAALLNQQGYHARWEAGPTGPRVLLRACPYAAVAASSPQVCAVDRFYLERITGLSLVHVTRMNHATGKPSACIFASRPGLFGD